MTKSIKTALIGCGYWGKNYLRLLKKNDFFQLTHVVDKADPNVDGVEYLDDISRLKDTDVDCAIVCTPTSTHFEISKQLLTLWHLSFSKKRNLRGGVCISFSREKNCLKKGSSSLLETRLTSSMRPNLFTTLAANPWIREITCPFILKLPNARGWGQNLGTLCFE